MDVRDTVTVWTPCVKCSSLGYQKSISRQLRRRDLEAMEKVLESFGDRYVCFGSNCRAVFDKWDNWDSVLRLGWVVT
jgi:hypothetical protein